MAKSDGTGPAGQGTGTGDKNLNRAKDSFPKWAAGKCICPKCGFNASPEQRENCKQKNCPRCGTKLTRALAL